LANLESFYIHAANAVFGRIPNLPFFYLAFRAWSHWRALSGGKHIQFLVENKLLKPTPSPVLDQVYQEQKPLLPSSPEPTIDAEADQLKAEEKPEGETMLLSQANGKKLAQALELPQLEVELERAIWQVETAIQKQNDQAGKKESTESKGDDEKKTK
jgi:hypothetical protein